MADSPVVHLGENSPEEVAFRLMTIVAKIEKKEFHPDPGPSCQSADRKYILDTYAECFQAVRGYRDF